MVTGPGNIYVVAAKRFLRGTVGIDSEAGPTEIAILADETADPRHIAADLMSQAEHDTLAAAVLVTDSTTLAEAVQRELAPMVSATLHSERIRTSLTSKQSAIVMVRDIDQGLEVVNAYAAEHLEIQTADAAAVAARVRNITERSFCMLKSIGGSGTRQSFTTLLLSCSSRSTALVNC